MNRPGVYKPSHLSLLVWIASNTVPCYAFLEWATLCGLLSNETSLGVFFKNRLLKTNCVFMMNSFILRVICGNCNIWYTMQVCISRKLDIFIHYNESINTISSMLYHPNVIGIRVFILTITCTYYSSKFHLLCICSQLYLRVVKKIID